MTAIDHYFDAETVVLEQDRSGLLGRPGVTGERSRIREPAGSTIDIGRRQRAVDDAVGHGVTV
jgi:hypothetical protein